MTAKFIIKVSGFKDFETHYVCDECGQTLNQGFYSTIQQHPETVGLIFIKKSTCSRSGKWFRLPTVDLEECPEPK